MRVKRHGRERRRGYERQRAFGTDEQAGENIDRVLSVEEGPQIVAHDVLDPVLASDQLRQGPTAPHPIAQGRKSLRDRRFLSLKAPPIASASRIVAVAIGQHELERSQGGVGVSLDS